MPFISFQLESMPLWCRLAVPSCSELKNIYGVTEYIDEVTVYASGIHFLPIHGITTTLILFGIFSLHSRYLLWYSNVRKKSVAIWSLKGCGYLIKCLMTTSWVTGTNWSSVHHPSQTNTGTSSSKRRWVLYALSLLVIIIYRKLSNIRRTKSQNLNDSRLVLHLSLPNLLKPGVK